LRLRSNQKFLEEIFIKYQEILKDFEVSDYKLYLEKIEQILNLDELKILISKMIKSDHIGLSYRYIENKYFMYVFYIDKTAYVISDELFGSKDNMTEIMIKILCSEKLCNKLYVWNSRHLIYPIIDHLKFEQKKNIHLSFRDVQIMNHIVLLDKNPSMKLKYNLDDYDKKINIFINKVHNDESFYYYIPRHIVENVLIKESILISMIGEAYDYAINKLNQNELLKKLQQLSVILSDIEKNNYLYYNKEKVIKLDVSNGFNKRLFNYNLSTSGSPIVLEYKHLNSTTGRLSFNNKSGINMMAIPKNEVRDTIIPEFNEFLSIDMSGAEVFYALKKYSNFLDEIEINNTFDIYSFINTKLSKNYKRSILKNVIISMFYGSNKFVEEELEIVLDIKNNLPELNNHIPEHIPEYIQTNNGRVIHVNKMITKYLNNIIQSETNDVMIDLIIRIWNKFNENGLKSKIKLLIHDQIIFDVIDNELDRVQQIIEKECDFFPFKIKCGKSLAKV